MSGGGGGNFANRYFSGLIGATNNVIGSHAQAIQVSQDVEDISAQVMHLVRVLRSELESPESGVDARETEYALRALEGIEAGFSDLIDLRLASYSVDLLFTALAPHARLAAIAEPLRDMIGRAG